MFAAILSILGSLVPTILQNSGIIGAGTTSLIANLLTPVEAMIANLKAGQSKATDALAVLAAMSGVIAVLKAKTSLPQAVLTQINNLDLDVQNALVFYARAEKGLDLTIYQQIDPVQ